MSDEKHEEIRRLSSALTEKKNPLLFSSNSVNVLFIIIIYLFPHFKKGTVCFRPKIAKANRGGRSYTQSVVKLVIIKLIYNNEGTCSEKQDHARALDI